VEVVSAAMPIEKLRTLLALLLKKISTPGRLKKLGFGSRLIGKLLQLRRPSFSRRSQRPVVSRSSALAAA
jgi:hypothetical protein